MAAIDEKLVVKVVGEVLARLKTQAPAAPSSSVVSGLGVYDDMNAAIAQADKFINTLP